ncbi:MAG: septum formation initiator family protein [Mariprofundaceae bacterium]|nr:septum formation initiator family protein [Mariprofundaceae bacterium]
MTYQLICSNHGYFIYQQEQQNIIALQQQAHILKQQHDSMVRRILQLRHNPKALENLVHERLGYVYPNEYILMMPDEKTQAKESK